MSRLGERLKTLESKMKRVEDMLEISPAVVSFDWKAIENVDKQILKILLDKGREGATTTEIAEALGEKDPEGSGRVHVYRRLKRIEKITRKVKGSPIVTSDRRVWSLNYDDFQFHVKGEKKKEKGTSEERDSTES